MLIGSQSKVAPFRDAVLLRVAKVVKLYLYHPFLWVLLEDLPAIRALDECSSVAGRLEHQSIAIMPGLH